MGEESVERKRLGVVGGAVPLLGRKVEDDGEEGPMVVHGSEDEFKRSDERRIFGLNPNPSALVRCLGVR